ncbi:TIGR03618 family F420-dependent PPOX class oxidoreductase [Allosaccharopolyspora coralli]|uniref:TIGR03618 family F420-dependent PPOX class oxidoreductase n=1 Tax=Allosaccharopolyspora coralli TaxID=2665642 RepID=A0A5Q3QD52_9PSEU|nr:PPOX class F420-dependent oxidoreductase [Allosaccharopolyspora coralli]QGK69415.1 TIGR03618 family F420-dependent PPOX class oxidoreductase [Allosaccharopolyspora coralli]
MASLADSEIRAFLEHGTRTAMVGFAARDGRPLVAPVWFVLDDEDVVFNTGRDTAKGRALARDPRLSLCVDMPELPYGFVQVQGVAEISDDPVEMLSWATRLGSRYMGENRAVEFGRRNAVPGELLVRLRPTKVIAELDMTGESS